MTHNQLEQFAVFCLLGILVIVLLVYKHQLGRALAALARLVDRGAFALGLDWRRIRSRWRDFRPD